TLLEALEIFFNNQIVKIDSGDACVTTGNLQVSIMCEFSDFPESIILDSGAETTLSSEFLLAKNGNLQIKKVYDCSKSKPSEQVFVICNHPSRDGYSSLLALKESELQAKIKAAGLDVSLKGNPRMRKAIWESVDDLECTESSLELGKSKEDGKRVWEKLESYLPIYVLFQSDRSNTDDDDEVQNPLNAAIKTAISEATDSIREIEQLVRLRSEEIANRTLTALKEIDPKLADSLMPKFTTPAPPKWASLFSIGMETNNGIQLNKRGSGIRRMILVGFFKAEADRLLQSSSKSNIIYAIEEPETAQHPSNQQILLQSFRNLALNTNSQVILTTHSPSLAGELPVEGIRFVTSRGGGSCPEILSGEDVLANVASTLGLFADHRVKALICVEGYTDIQALKKLSHLLCSRNENLPDLSTDPRFAFVLLGGSNLKHWVDNHYLKALGLPEVHIYDSDVKKYSESVDKVNARPDNSWATLTRKSEIECYLHPDAIHEEFGYTCEVRDSIDVNYKGVPSAFAIEWQRFKGLDNPPKDDKAKAQLVKAFSKMTYERLQARNAVDEIKLWMQKILEAIN
ncbi:MAG: hypothetical protein RIR04_1062, partial [Pseudomonadota bacterium]